MRIFLPGNHEPMKGHVHSLLGALALLCACYNATAFVLRHERHLAVNAVVYSTLAVYECRAVRHHRAAVVAIVIKVIHA